MSTATDKTRIKSVAVAFFRVGIVPIVSVFPPTIAYGVGRLFGDILYYTESDTKKKIVSNLEEVFGDSLTSEQRRDIARKFFRVRCCEYIDDNRLRGKGGALMELVTVEGKENVDAALAQGKGAILCGSHYGSAESAASLMGALGLPLTPIARWSSDPKAYTTLTKKIFYYFATRPYSHHFKRHNIDVREKKIRAGFLASRVVERDEVVVTMMDAPVAPEDRSRTIHIDFLGRQGMFLPGAARIARHAGAPLFFMIIRRSPDLKHQKLKVYGPVDVSVPDDQVYRHCLAITEAAIRSNPEQWRFWVDDRIARLGLIPGEMPPGPHHPQDIIFGR